MGEEEAEGDNSELTRERKNLENCLERLRDLADKCILYCPKCDYYTHSKKEKIAISRILNHLVLHHEITGELWEEIWAIIEQDRYEREVYREGRRES